MTDRLITSLEQAGEGSRELDAEIADLFDPVPDQHDGFQGRWPFVPGSPYSDQTPPVTTSIDAALALAERLHPCWSWSVGQNVHHKYWLAYALALDGDRSSFQTTVAKAKRPALALCIAILRATQETT